MVVKDTLVVEDADITVDVVVDVLVEQYMMKRAQCYHLNLMI
jgi:hypothetical protein